MGQVVLLVVGAAWAAVLIPPLLRSRGQNRPNSSVSDFRDQLTSLQKVSRSVQMRSMGRSLVAASAERPARSDFTGRHTAITLHPTSGASSDGGRPAASATSSSESRRHHGGERLAGRRHEPARGERTHRQLAVDRRDSRAAVKRRRANVLFLLVLATFCTLVVAISTRSAVMLYVFAAVFVALAGYIYLLGQARLREDEEAAPAPLEMVDVTPPRSAPARRRPTSAASMGQVRQHRQQRFDLA